LDVGTAASDANLYLPLRQDLAELLSRQLPDDAFHLPIKKRSQNFGRIQAGAFHNIINMHRLLGTQQLVELFLRAIQLRSPRVSRRTNAVLRAFHHHHSEWHVGKFSGAGCVRSGNSLIIAPRSSTFSYSFLFSFG
jgi:hypothetical protein